MASARVRLRAFLRTISSLSNVAPCCLLQTFVGAFLCGRKEEGKERRTVTALPHAPLYCAGLAFSFKSGSCLFFERAAISGAVAFVVPPFISPLPSRSPSPHVLCGICVCDILVARGGPASIPSFLCDSSSPTPPYLF